MNASGVSAFYGASERTTCLAEVRPPVGSQVVSARFNLLRSVRLIDLEVLKNVYGGGESYFDPTYSRRASQAAFLRKIVEEIAQPVMPHDETSEYIPTQAVAEYLANCVVPRLDGMIFHSSQTGGEGRNIVLFNHACRVQGLQHDPNIETSIDLGTMTDEGYDNTITISESETPPRDLKEPDGAQNEPGDDWLIGKSDPVFAPFPEDIELEAPDGDPTLKIDVGSIEIEVVQRVKHDTVPRYIYRYRSSKDDISF